MHFVPEDGIYTYFRYTTDECVMVILNKNDDKKLLNTERFTEMMAPYNKGKELITSKEITDLTKIQLNAKSAAIIELSK